MKKRKIKHKKDSQIDQIRYLQKKKARLDILNLIKKRANIRETPHPIDEQHDLL